MHYFSWNKCYTFWAETLYYSIVAIFYGLDREDLYMHVKDFFWKFVILFDFKIFSNESVRLRLFPFSLNDKSKAWLNSLPARSSATCDELVNKFLAKIFLPCLQPIIFVEKSSNFIKRSRQIKWMLWKIKGFYWFCYTRFLAENKQFFLKLCKTFWYKFWKFF